MSVDLNTYTAQMITQMALVQGSITTVGTLENATPKALEIVYAAVANALVPFNQAIAAYEADIDTTTVGGVVTGVAPLSVAATLLTQTDDVEQEAVLIVTRAYLARVGANINNATG